MEPETDYKKFQIAHDRFGVQTALAHWLLLSTGTESRTILVVENIGPETRGPIDPSSCLVARLPAPNHEVQVIPLAGASS